MYIWFHWNCCISLSNEFGTNVFRSSLEKKVKTENLSSHIWDKVLKSGPSRICGRHPLKNVK